MGSERCSPEKWIDDDCSNKNKLICCQPTLFEAVQDSSAPDWILNAPTSHCLVPDYKVPKRQEDSVEAAMRCLGDVCSDSKRFKMFLHPVCDER